MAARSGRPRRGDRALMAQRSARLYPANGNGTLKALSTTFIFDLQDTWKRHGKKALHRVAIKHPVT
jgi:hypothetical protein